MMFTKLALGVIPLIDSNSSFGPLRMHATEGGLFWNLDVLCHKASLPAASESDAKHGFLILARGILVESFPFRN